MYDLSLSEARVPAQGDMQVDRVAIGELLRAIAAERPQAEALVEVTQAGEVGRRWTYAGVLEDSERLALALASRFEPGDYVVVWAPNSPEWVLMEYACALAGLVLVTANPAFQVKELRYVLEHSGAVALFLVDEFRGNPMAQIGREAIEGLKAIREVTDLNDNEALFRHESANPSLPAVTPEDAAQIQYTSGTTGFPKGAVLSHLGLVNNARFYASRCGVDTASTWINILPMFHTSGCGMVTLGCLQVGCRMVLVSLFDPGVINGLIESEKATIILGVPTMVIALQDAFEAKPGDVSTLEVVSCGGAMVAPELVRRVQRNYGCGFSTLYGQTEHCPVITQHHLDDTIDDRFTGRKHFWSACIVDRPKNPKRFSENLELYRPEGDFTEEEVIQFKTDLTGVFPINLVITPATVQRLQEKFVPPISEFDPELCVCWFIPRKIVPRKTKNGKNYWIVEVIDSNNELTRIRCWGIKPEKDRIHLNRPYMARLKYDENWGFSTYAVGKTFKLLG